MYRFGAFGDLTMGAPPPRNLEDYPPYGGPPQLETHRALQSLFSQNNWLISEVKTIKETLLELNAEIKGKLSQLADPALLAEQLTVLEKPKKKFKKSIDCPYSDCHHRYSSKIALNCHIRTKHTLKMEQ
jgi:hypothetical protein